ncbi:hypothetical protein FQN55_004339 [Onygenales sp. PD_40]|nr:hypothetical protein FQN55_004339 [Onygenales sp. PD_40]
MCLHPVCFALLLHSGKYSDCKIVCQGEVFHVHRAVVCTQSPVIAAAIDGGFKESHTSTMHLDDFDVKIVREMLQYLYQGELSFSLSSLCIRMSAGEEVDAALDASTRLHAIADYLGICSLKLECIDSIEQALSQEWRIDKFITTTRTMLTTTHDANAHRRLGIIAAGYAGELMESDEFKALDLPPAFTLEMIRSILQINEASSSIPTKRARRQIS